MRRLQFSIRTLLWLTLVVAILCMIGPPALREYRDYQQRRDFRELVRLIRETIRPGGGLIENAGESESDK